MLLISHLFILIIKLLKHKFHLSNIYKPVSLAEMKIGAPIRIELLILEK
jgi:hypothetical protein